MQTRAVLARACLIFSLFGVAACATLPEGTATVPSPDTGNSVGEQLAALPGTVLRETGHVVGGVFSGLFYIVVPTPRTKPSTIFTAGLDPRVIRASRRLQCVPFARARSGVEIYGDAVRWWEKAATTDYAREAAPSVGSVMVLKGYRSGRRGHVAVVTRMIDSRTIVIDHANWLNDGRIYLDQPVVDVSPNNDWTEVRVWYTPDQKLGDRVYQVKGFITRDLPVVPVAQTQQISLTQ